MTAQNTTAAPPDLLTQDEVTAIVLAVARCQAGPGATEPYPAPDMDRVARVVEWAQGTRFDESLLNLALEGRVGVDFDPDQDDIVYRALTP